MTSVLSLAQTATDTRPAGRADGAAVRPRAELEHFDRRLEYWDAATETA